MLLACIPVAFFLFSVCMKSLCVCVIFILTALHICQIIMKLLKYSAWNVDTIKSFRIDMKKTMKIEIVYDCCAVESSFRVKMSLTLSLKSFFVFFSSSFAQIINFYFFFIEKQNTYINLELLHAAVFLLLLLFRSFLCIRFCDQINSTENEN